MRRGIFLLLVCLFVAPTVAHAQVVATPNNHLSWSQVGQTPATAGAAVYNGYLDAITTGTPVGGVACVAGVPATDSACTSNLPVLTVGQHTLTLTQVISGAESSKSNSITFTFVVVVQPTTLRIAKLLVFWHGGALASRGRADLRRVLIRPR